MKMGKWLRSGMSRPLVPSREYRVLRKSSLKYSAYCHRWVYLSTQHYLLSPQICFPQPFVFEQISTNVGQHDAPGLQDVAARGNRKRHVRVLFDHEDRHAQRVDLLDD